MLNVLRKIIDIISKNSIDIKGKRRVTKKTSRTTSALSNYYLRKAVQLNRLMFFLSCWSIVDGCLKLEC